MNRLLLPAALLCVVPAFAQSISYQLPAKAWDATLGSHRAVVRVESTASAVRAHLEWRRRDPRPEAKGVVVVDAKSGQRLSNAAAVAVTAETGDVVFEPAGGVGEYFVYFLPGNPGSGSFPQAKYLPPQDAANAEWKTKAQIADEGWKKLPEVKAVRWEARTEHDRFSEMEIIATRAEGEAWVAAHPGQPFFVFAEDRARPVRMFDHVPELWLKREGAPEFAAQPNEEYVFQLGVWAARGDLRGVRAQFHEVRADGGAMIPAAAFRCFQTDGTDWLGREFGRGLDVAAGNVQPLWCAVRVPRDATGTYRGELEITALEVTTQRVPFSITVGGEVLVDGGDSDPAKLTKLGWLDSQIAQDDEPTKPFTPLRIEGRSIRCLGRSVTLGEDGLPAQITSYFSGSNTHTDAPGRELLTAPMRFVVEMNDGRMMPLRGEGMRFSKERPGRVEWTGTLSGDPLAFLVVGAMEFDGSLNFRITGSSRTALEVRDIRLEIPRTVDTAKYILGLGQQGGARPAKLEWKWDVKKNQDSVWLGDVSAGLRVQLRGENYVRPFVNIHYPRQPLNLPPAWGNAGRGGIDFAERDRALVLRATSGPRTVNAAEALHFDFDLLVTPFRTLNTEAQWRDRYYQVGGMPAAPEKVREAGANVVNIHQGNALNPYINYPFLTADKLRDYTTRAHAAGLRVKYYYTVRELTNWAPELFAMKSFGDELIAPGKGGGHAWSEEHLGGDYWQAWYEPGVNDASILTASMSRFHNLYLEGLRWLVENTGCDGVYLDDVSYDRTVTKRARKILDRADPRGGLIDLHSWNELNGMAGFANCANVFMDSLPFVDRIWFGEGHNYAGPPPEHFLVEISGVPFGVMGEMLEGGGNAWLGLTFGMTGRLGWGGAPQMMWKLWDEFGMADTEFIGWWDDACPVKPADARVKATVFTRPGRTLVAIANFAGEPVRTALAIDFARLGLDPRKASLYAPEMTAFQPELLFKPDATIALAPYRGFAFILDETPRTPPKTIAALAFDRTKLLSEETFASKTADGWKVVASARAKDVPEFDGEGLVFLAPANVHAWLERELPAETAVVAAQIRQDTGDEGQSWGPGLALVWPGGKSVKVNRRKDGRFSIAAQGREELAGMCDRELPVTLMLVLGKDSVRVLATGEGTYQQDQQLAKFPRSSFPGAPALLRVGKIPNSGNPDDHSDPGQMGWSRADWVRVYRE